MSDDLHRPSPQHGVPDADEEGLQVSDGAGRAEHPGRDEVPGEAGRPARKDPEGARRVPREGAVQLPQVINEGGKGDTVICAMGNMQP